MDAVPSATAFLTAMLDTLRSERGVQAFLLVVHRDAGPKHPGDLTRVRFETDQTLDRDPLMAVLTDAVAVLRSGRRPARQAMPDLHALGQRMLAAARERLPDEYERTALVLVLGTAVDTEVTLVEIDPAPAAHLVDRVLGGTRGN